MKLTTNTFRTEKRQFRFTFECLSLSQNLGPSSSMRNPAVVGAKLSDHQLDCHSCENIMMVVHPGKCEYETPTHSLFMYCISLLAINALWLETLFVLLLKDELRYRGRANLRG